MRSKTFWFAITFVVSLVVWGNPAAPEPVVVQGPSGPVPAGYFGMHVHRLLTSTAWPSVPFASLRLWDTGTTWNDIEPQKGDWHFTTLDRLVQMAAAHNVQVLLCFGKTPRWASAIHVQRDSDKSFQAGQPANLDDWRDFVQKVVTRYKGRIAAYEIWNEPSYHEYYIGDVHAMVEMTRIGSQVIHSVDRSALVVSPSATTFDGLPWFGKFLDDGGARYVDVIGYHLYVSPQPPEKIVQLAQSVRNAMSQHHVNLPLWDTETGWAGPKKFDSDQEQAAYTARTLLLGWTSGISRLYWYAWDNRNWVTLNLTAGEDNRPTAAAQAFSTVEGWMVGQRIDDCTQRADRTWVCHLSKDGKDSYIIWNPDARAKYAPTAAGAGQWKLTTLSGETGQASASDIYADAAPKLLQWVSR